MRRGLYLAGAVLFAAALIAVLPRAGRPRPREYFLCEWEDGAVTHESYNSAYSSMIGIAADAVLLQKNSRTGAIRGGEDFVKVRQTLETGEIAALFALGEEDLTALERAALFRAFSDVGYYSSELYTFDGVSLIRSERRTCSKIVLLSGDLPAGFLRETGAQTLEVGAEAELTARALVGSELKEFLAREPYFERGGALYVESVAGVRLVCALPHLTSLRVTCDFADEGALAACTRLETLTLPAKFTGELERLFGGAPHPERVYLE